MSQQNKDHTTVLLEEAVKQLNVQAEHTYIDCTFGRAHCRNSQAGGTVIALDWDEDAITAGEERFKTEIAAGKLRLIRESFSKLRQVASQLKVTKVSGILFDFGTSTNQLMSAERGFSFQEDGDLDMRMDNRLGVKAKDILAIIPEKQLIKLFTEFGGEDDAWKIAKAIKKSPEPITTTGQLATLIERVKRVRHGKLHPATKSFRLKIAVNSELDEITQMPQALQL
jgi:16S rRNA (cytosine1402-N4)-methyltransferase